MKSNKESKTGSRIAGYITEKEWAEKKRRFKELLSDESERLNNSED